MLGIFMLFAIITGFSIYSIKNAKEDEIESLYMQNKIKPVYTKEDYDYRYNH